ncbi:MAG TPA: tetratricopeptide repeat protein [Dongiaceae bacterium]|jgi:Flp pilus assembly protein TadD
MGRLPVIRSEIRKGFLQPLAVGALTLILVAGVSGCTTTQQAGSPPPAGSVTPDTMMRLADTTRQSGDLGQAAGLYQRAAQLEPKNPKPLVELAGVYAQLQMPKDAAQAWTAVLALDPKNTTALRGLANAQLQTGDTPGAIQNLQAAQAILPDWRNDNSLGVAYDMRADHASAVKAYKDGLSLDPGNLQLTNNLGLSLALSGDFTQALPLLESSARDPRATPRMRQNLALAYGLSGDDKKAAEVAKQDLDPAGVKENLGYYEFLRLLQDRNAIASTLGAHQTDALN